MYSLIPKVDRPESHSSGASRPQIEAYPISIVDETLLTTTGSSSNLSTIKVKSGLMSRVFGSKSRGAASPELDKEPNDDIFSLQSSQSPQSPQSTGLPLISPAPYLQPLKFKLVARAEPSCLSSPSIGREPGPAPLTSHGSITFWPQISRDSSMEDVQRGRKSPNLNKRAGEYRLKRNEANGSTTSLEKHLQERIEFTLDHQAGDIAHVFGSDPESIKSWTEYVENYSGVSSPSLPNYPMSMRRTPNLHVNNL
jgi:hypothetical protein